MNPAIVSLIQEKGLLLQKELFDLIGQFSDLSAARIFLDSLEKASGQKMITLTGLANKGDFLFTSIQRLPDSERRLVETTLVTIGLHVEVRNISQPMPIVNPNAPKSIQYQIFYADTKNTKKIDVNDFVGHFRSRYQQIQRILMQRADLPNLVSINKIPRDRQRFSFIGILREKRITKNKNLSLVFEDLTGSVNALVRAQNECFSKAAELQLDDVVGIKAAGGSEVLFVHDIVYPDSFKERVRFNEDACVAFVSDIHVGSVYHRGAEFEKFLDWINSEDELAKKIQFIFFVGDNVDGVGVFPGQERLLTTKSLKDQYLTLAGYLSRIPSHITMFMCPGQHDSVRVAEPQPIIDSVYGAPLYNIPNLTLVSNPSLIKLFEGEKEFRVLMYHGASIHSFINEIEELRLLKAHRCPAKAVKHMLKRRHLAPTHSEVSYVPNALKDPLVLCEVPDVLCTGEVHRLDIESYNGVMIITGSCWQSQTEFEEKVGNVPDPCKVPVFNLKSRELKILDFTGT